MADHFQSRPTNNASSAALPPPPQPTSRAPPTLSVPLLHPHPYQFSAAHPHPHPHPPPLSAQQSSTAVNNANTNTNANTINTTNNTTTTTNNNNNNSSNNNNNNNNSNVASSSPSLPSIPPFSSLPSSSTTSSALPLPSTSQLAPQDRRITSLSDSQRVGESAPPPSSSSVDNNHASNSNNNNTSNNTSNTKGSATAVAESVDRFQHALPPPQQIQRMDRYSSHPAHHQHHPLPPPPPHPPAHHTSHNPHHHPLDRRSNATSTPPPPSLATLQPLPMPSHMEHPRKSVLPSFHESTVGKPDLPMSMQDRFGHPHLQPLSIPSIQTLSGIPSSTKGRSISSHPTSPSRQSHRPTQPHPHFHPRPPQSVVPPPSALSTRPAMLVPPRVSGMMQTIPEFQRNPLPPTSSHTPSPPNPEPLRRPSLSPDFSQHYRPPSQAPDLRASPYDDSRSVQSHPHLHQSPPTQPVLKRVEPPPMPSPDRDLSSPTPVKPELPRIGPTPTSDLQSHQAKHSHPQDLHHQPKVTPLHHSPQLPAPAQPPQPQQRLSELLQSRPQPEVSTLEDSNRSHPLVGSSQRHQRTPPRQDPPGPVHRVYERSYEHTNAAQSSGGEGLYHHPRSESPQHNQRDNTKHLKNMQDRIMQMQHQDNKSQHSQHSRQSSPPVYHSQPQADSLSQHSQGRQAQPSSASQSIASRAEKGQQRANIPNKSVNTSIMTADTAPMASKPVPINLLPVPGGPGRLPLETKAPQVRPSTPQNAMPQVPSTQHLSHQKDSARSPSKGHDSVSPCQTGNEERAVRDRSVDSGAPLVTITPLPPIQTNMQTNLPIPTKLGTDRDMDVDSRPHSQRQPEAPINPHAPHQNETQPQMMEIDTPGPGDRNEGGNMSNSLTSRVLPSVGRNRADDISLAASGHAPQKGQNPYESNIAQDDSSHLKGENNSTENQKSEWKRHNSALRNSTDFDVRMGTSSVAEDKDGDLSMGMRRWESVTTKSGGGGANEGIGNTEAMDSTATVDRHTWGVNSGNVSRHAHAQSHNMAIPQSSNHPIRQQQHLPQTLSSSKQHPHLPLHHPSSSVAQPQSDPSSHPPEQPQQQQQHHHAQKPSVPAPTSVPAPKPPANPSPDSSPILKQSVPNVMPIQHPVGPSSPSRAASSGPAASAGHSESQTKSTRTPVKPVVLPGVAAPSTGSASPQAPSDREARQDNEPNSPRLNPSSRPQADSGRLEQAYNSPLTQPSRNPQQQEQQQEQQQQHRKQQQKQEQQEQEQPQPQQEEQQQKSKQQPQQQQQEQQQSQPPPPPQQKHLKVEDALAYLEKVKRQFSDQQNVYNQFLDVMKDFKAQNIDTSEVIKRVSELFRGHKDLILGFNTFLPPGYKIQFTENLATGTLNAGFVGPHGDFSELPTYRNSTTKPPTARFGQNRSKPVAAPPKPSKENVKRVPSTPVQPGNSTTTAALVTNNSSSSAAAGKEPVQIAANGPSAKHVAGHTSSKAPQKQQQSMTPKQSIKEEEVRQPQQSASVPLVQKSVEGHQAKSVEFERAITFMTQIKERFSKESDTFTQFLGAMKHFRDEQKSIREVFDTVAHLFGPHKDLLMKFKEFIPHSQKPSSDRNADSPLFLPPNRPPSPNPTSKVAKNGRDLKFFEKMKVQLGNNKSHLYIEFIKCLSLLSQGIVSQEELVLLTSGILHECPEAQTAFLNYLESFGNNDSSNSSLDDSSSSSSEKGDAPIDEARLQYYKTKQMSEIAAECGIDSIVSYRRMPRDFPKIHYSGRSPQERRILNDTWVNITTGSEDFAFVRKNGCEDNLFRAEDDRYELDMVISTNRATIQKLEVVVSTMSKLSPAEKTRHALATGVLSAIHFNSIRRIYGPHGDEVVSQVRMNPSVAVPIVIPRLKQKDAEWRKVRNEMNKFWRDIGERNFHRSLDHRFGFFKMIDKKDLNMKSLLLDLMDPASSQTARDYEMTRARNYAIPKGAGSTFDRSGATKAVLEAARIAHDYAPRSLRLKFENLWMHKTTFNLIEAASSDEASVGLRRCIAEFGKILEDFFDVDLETGLRRGSEPEDAMETDDAKPKQQANKKSEEKRREFAAANTIDRDVLFGDEAIYVMFRLYHILYERVFTAFEMAHEQVSDRERRERLNEIAGNRVSTESIVKPRLMKFASEKETDGGFALGPETGDGMDVFSRFLEYARPFVRSKLDSSRYEERCRVLLGTGAYCVFTLDKVMQRLIKQIQAVFGSDRVAQELMVIFEKARAAKERNSQRVGGKLDPEGMVELYSIATSRLLSEMRQPGTHLIRFERDYCELRERVLEVGDVRLRRSGVFPDDENSPKSVNVREVTRDKKGCVFSIEVLGETGDEEHFRALEERQECIDSFLGFCASYEDCKVHGPSRDGSFDNGNNVMNSVSGSGAYDGNEYGQTSSRRNKNHGGSDGYGNHHEHMNSNHKSGGGKSQGSGRNGGHSKGTSSVKQRERERERERNRDGTGGSSNKRNNNWSMDVNHANNKSSGANIMRSIDNKRRRLDSQLRRYQPSERKHMIRRAMATVVDNGLRCKMDTNGAVRYMAGTLDWSFTPGRKRRWSDIMLASSSELRKQNEEQRSTKKLRNFLTEYHSKKKDSGNAVVISLATSSRSHSGDDGGGNHANGGSGKRRDRGEGGKGKNRSNSNN